MLVVPFSLGIRGSYHEPTWQAALEHFEIRGDKATKLMTELTLKCLNELDELFSVRSAALRIHSAHAGAT